MIHHDDYIMYVMVIMINIITMLISWWRPPPIMICNDYNDGDDDHDHDHDHDDDDDDDYDTRNILGFSPTQDVSDHEAEGRSPKLTFQCHWQ